MRRLVAAILVIGTLSCDDIASAIPGTPPDEVTIVTTSANRFSPSSVELAVGGTATFVFNATGHTVVFSDVPGRPANIGLTVSASVTRTFNTAGTFPYHCTVHTSPPMTGTIIVR